MGRVLRGALVLVGIVVVIALVAGGGLLSAITASGQPQLSGTVAIPGLAGEVEVSRDASGVTHITTSTSHDLFLAQGWVHASERLWQMEIYRRIGAGRLSELFGASQVATDSFIRTVNWRGAARRDLDALSDESRGFLGAYSDGVNAYLDGHPNALGTAFVVAGLLGGEGDGLGGLRPEPWTPLDTLTFAKLQAWSLGGNIDTEIFRMLADAQLGDPALTDQLFQPYPADRPVIAAPEEAASVAHPDGGPSGDPVSTTGPAPAAGAPVAAGTAESREIVGAPDAAAWTDLGRLMDGIGVLAGLTPETNLVGTGGVGSNNWVVGPSRTTTGSALLANDPHLAFSMPSI